MLYAGVLIEAERGRLDISAKIKGREREEFFISVVTASELLRGVWRAKGAKVRSKRSAFVENVLEQFPVLAVDLPTARIHAQIWADLDSKGSPIGPHDAWIAAACIAHGLTLATGNIREFKKIPGLSVEDWSS